MRPEAAGVVERIRREARVVGLRDFESPSLEAVEQRRMQLWIITTVLLVGVSVGTAVVSMWSGTSVRTWLTPQVLRASVVLLSAGFCAYAIEKELHLRRLSRLLIDERVLTAALSNRLREVSHLLEVGKAMNSVLELGSVLDIILRSALDLLSGKSGSILLVDGKEALRAACVRGNDLARDRRVRVGDGIAGHVALTREALLISGHVDPEDFPGLPLHEQYVDSAMCVPLIHRDQLLGVLSVNADADREFTEYDLRALSLFAEQSASAITNARLYEAERSHVEELLELDRMKSEFVALVSHELRTPLTSILAASKTAQRPEMTEQHEELLHIIERQTRRLSSMVEDLLAAAKLEQVTLPTPAPVDLASLVRLAARDFEVADQPVELDVPDSVPVLADPESLRRVLDNLVDNAYKYGAPPVRVVVEHQGDRVMLSVVDGGPGVPAEARETVFDRFSRLERGSEQPGLGLGLPIVRGLVAACGGSIWIEDAPGGGAVFRVALPEFQSEKEAV